jgi:hypothetical protein
LTEEREKHIAERHPDLLPTHHDRIVETLFNPDQIRRSRRFGDALLFSRWFEDILAGKFVVVVVITNERPWIITAYVCQKLIEGEPIWTRN